MSALHANRGCERGEPQVEGHRLRFDARFLLLVGEDLPDAVARRIGVIGKPKFVVLVVGDAAPETDRVNDGARRAPLAFAYELCLMRIDPRVAGLGRRLPECDRARRFA